MDDASGRRHHAEVGERRLSPPQELVSLLVSLELLPRLMSSSVGPGEGVDLHRMIDHQVGGDQWVDLLRRPSSPVIRTMADRIAARSTMAGTPVKSWSTTRPGTNGISLSPTVGSVVGWRPFDVLVGKGDPVVMAQH